MKKAIAFILIGMFCLAFTPNALAAENIPVVDDSKDYSAAGDVNYTYEDDFIIQS